ncbi:MAG: DUF1015 family protein [Clostridia bacterium]|nr:DUF1015 family protein [Clostridia bacterium]
MMNYVRIPEILLPNETIDIKNWAVIACDQFTSQEEYWEELNKSVGEVSALRVIYPEVYLGKNQEERIKSIKEKMKEYLFGEVFRKIDGFILTVRKTKYGHRRVGLMISIDLEQYNPFTNDRAVKATEETVVERLPIRIQIRKNASIELPHALILMDDDTKSIIEPIYDRRESLDKLYDSELNGDGGHIEGYLVDNPQEVLEGLELLINKERLMRKYGTENEFLFVVGDGNHSIAAAKAYWDELKVDLTEEERENHPARYALCELNNLYDDELLFEPIHRVVFGAGEEFIDAMTAALQGDSQIELNYRGKHYFVNIPSCAAVAIRDIQGFIDGYIKTNTGAMQDYVHGYQHTLAVAGSTGIAIFMPTIQKGEIFVYVEKNGVLPRKAFSMGEAEEKRYYLESKLIKNNWRL